MMEPITENVSSANALRWAAEVLRGRFAEVLSLREYALQTDDIEGVHKMRVALRRLRSSLRDFSPYLKQRPLKEAKKDLKRLSNALGAARDEDVAIAALEKLREKAKNESVKKGLAKMIAKRRAAREKTQTMLVETLDAAEIENLGERFLAAVGEVSEANGKAAGLMPEQMGRAVIAANLREFCALSDALYDPFAIKRLHELRIAAKRLRYAVELFDTLLSERLAPFSEEIADMQTFLGELHDADVWIEDLSRRLQKAKSPKKRAELWLLSRFTSRRTKQYRAALKLWSRWRKTHFTESLRAALETADESK